MNIKRLEFENNAVAIEGMDRKDWEILREGIMSYGNAEHGLLFRFFAGAPYEFQADCVGSTEQDNQTTAMMAYIEQEFLAGRENEALVIINANFWDLFIYPVITQTEDYSDQTREMISEDIKVEGFWDVVDKIIAAWKEVRT